MSVARAAAVAIAIGIAAQVVAWEYPRTPLRSALANGQLAFRGRVEALTQVERHLSHTLARAHVRIGDCLYGNCAKGDVVQIDYLAQSISKKSVTALDTPLNSPLVPMSSSYLHTRARCEGGSLSIPVFVMAPPWPTSGTTLPMAGRRIVADTTRCTGVCVTRVL